MKKTYIIGEIGINHNGKLKNCLKLIRTASKCGVDAVKFQNWVAEDFISDKNQIFKYQSRGKKVKETFYNLCKRTELKKKWLKTLSSYCKKNNVDFLSTPTSNTGVDELKKLKVKYMKNGSDYLTNIDLIKYMAKNFKNIILSTGMSYEEDIDIAIKSIKSLKKNNNIILLHCTSIYPTKKESTNLNRMLAIKQKFNTQIGFSDHTIGWESAVQAVSMGASFLEKHITLDHKMSGPDHWFSLNPKELKNYVDKVRDAEKALGSNKIIPDKYEMKNLKEQRLSVIIDCNVKKGQRLKKDYIKFKKPGTGISPNKIEKFLGKKLKKDVKKNSVLLEKHFK